MARTTYKNKAGVKVPSVTTIIGDSLGWNKNALFYWAIKMMKMGIDPIKERDKAAALGTLVHAYIEAYIYGTVVDDEMKNNYTFDDIVVAERGLTEFKRKEKELKVEWKESELGLVSEKYQYGGTLDGVCLIDGVLTLIDTKSSNAIYADHLIQLGAYDNMLTEVTEYRPDAFRIIKVNKDKEQVLADSEIVKFVEVPKSMIVTGFEVFKHLRELHEIKSSFEKEVKQLTEQLVAA